MKQQTGRQYLDKLRLVALMYRELGHRPIPVDLERKKPLIFKPTGEPDRRGLTTVDQINEYFGPESPALTTVFASLDVNLDDLRFSGRGTNPECVSIQRFGLAVSLSDRLPGGLFEFVLDFDTPEAFEKFEGLPETFTVRTPCGYHAHYLTEVRLPTSRKFRSETDLLASGLMVIVPPSIGYTVHNDTSRTALSPRANLVSFLSGLPSTLDNPDDAYTK